MKRKLYHFTHQPWASYEECQPGTPEWAERISGSLQIHSRHMDSTFSVYFPKTLKAIIASKTRPWEIFPKDNPFGSPDIYCQAVTGHSWEALLTLASELDPEIRRAMQAILAEAQAKTVTQGARTDRLHYDRMKLNQGESQAYLLRRIANADPKVLARYRAGEFKSVAAAARAAGIKVGQSILQKLRSDWKKASPEERKIFKEEINQ